MTALVLDASAVVEYLRGSAAGTSVATLLDADDVSLHVPHLCVVEVASALRGLVLAKKLPAQRGADALDDLRDLSATRHAVEPLLPRIWALRANLTAYDATYVALAEALGATLITADRKLVPTYRRRIEVRLVRG